MARWLGTTQLRVKFVVWGAVAVLSALALVAAVRAWMIEPVWGRSGLTDAASLVLLVGLLLGPLWIFIGREVLRPLEVVLEADRKALQGDAEGRLIPESAIPDGELGALLRSRNELLRHFERLTQAGRDLVHALGRAANEVEFLQSALEALAKLTEAQYGAMGILDKDGRYLHFLNTGLSEEEVARIGDLPAGRGVLGVILEEGSVLRLEDVGRHPRAYGVPPHHPVMKSLLAAPIITKGLKGRIYLCNKAKDQPFSEADEALVVAFTRSLQLALEEIALKEEIKAHVQALGSLVEATKEFTAAPSGPALLEAVAESARRVTGARYAALGVFDETGERLVQFITAGMDEATKAAIGRLPTGRGLLGVLAKEERALRLKDLTQHPSSMGFPPNHPPMRSFLGISIRAHGKLFGRLYLTEKLATRGTGPLQPEEQWAPQATGAPEEFTDLDEKIIAELAAHAAQAIENAQLMQQIQTAEERYRVTMASLPVPVVRLGKDRTIRLANRAFYDLVHRRPEDILGCPIGAVLPVEGIEESLEAARAGGGPPAEREVECLMPTGGSTGLTAGERRVLRLTVSGIRRADDDDDDDDDDDAIIAIEDHTERKQLEAQLRQAQKMEAVGRLAGGIAHDFNNMLTVVTGYSHMLLDGLGPDNPLAGSVAEIQKAGKRAATLTRQLLAFSRKQVLEPRVLDLNALVANMEGMLRRLIGEDIALRTVPGPGLGQVRADPGQLEQVIMNLVINARDAMPQGGRLTIETKNVEWEAASGPTPFSLPPGPYVTLAVTDTGCGMDAETQARIFEPFFTTKEQGKGTGLGLSTVYGIVKQSGGYIWVKSQPGQGATFTIYLPRVEEEAEPTRPLHDRADLAGGSETILLVEDEDLLRTLAHTVLQTKGYTVLEAKDGAEALRLCQEHPGSIHLLLTDMVMPGMSGRDLADRVTALRPQTKTLFMSGYMDQGIAHENGLRPGMAFLHKPFTPDALARKVREVLDRTSRG